MTFGIQHPNAARSRSPPSPAQGDPGIQAFAPQRVKRRVQVARHLRCHRGRKAGESEYEHVRPIGIGGQFSARSRPASSRSRN